MPGHLELAMRKIWYQNAGNKGIRTHADAKKILKLY